MHYRNLGETHVSAVGLGAMPLSIENRPDEARAIATIHAALDAGITLIDTADSYHWHADETGHNELLIARALAAYGQDTSGILVATKGGRGRPGDGSWTVTGTPEHLKRACEGSLKRLGTDVIGLYQLHKPDPAVRFTDSVGALAELVGEGKVRKVGLSNVTVDQIRQAHAILGDDLVSVQNEFSPSVRDSAPELRLCAELGLAFLPWSPLGGISHSSLDGPSNLGTGTPPKFAGFHQLAAEKGVSPQQICLAWHLHLAPTTIVIPGSSRPETIRASAAAADLTLTPEDLARL
ncbi:aldo/keto reductase [Streptomyces sp. NPDC020883]|uniref:aldo/keto reductase n=1 Tax=Streptomyces sp. NPDC020883 TaxID=3365099 RepID=UPI00378BBCC7